MFPLPLRTFACQLLSSAGTDSHVKTVSMPSEKTCLMPVLSIESTLSKMDTFGNGTKCPSWRKGGTNSGCPFYSGVR